MEQIYIYDRPQRRLWVAALPRRLTRRGGKTHVYITAMVRNGRILRKMKQFFLYEAARVGITEYNGAQHRPSTLPTLLQHQASPSICRMLFQRDVLEKQAKHVVVDPNDQACRCCFFVYHLSIRPLLVMAGVSMCDVYRIPQVPPSNL